MENWGNKLKKIREDKKLSLADIEKETNINIRILNHIESGNFEKLPKGIFAKNFIRQYCEFIGFNPNELFEDVFENENKNNDEYPIEDYQPVSNIDYLKYIKYLFVIILLLIFIFFAYKRITKDNNENSNILESNNSINQSQLIKKPDLREGAITKPITNNNVELNKNANKIEEKDINNISNEVKNKEPEKQVSKKIIVKPGKLQIEAMDEDCWIHFVCNDLVEDFIIKKGEIISYSCNGIITFDIGNTPVVQITYNGNKLEFPKNKKVVKNFSIDLDNIEKQEE